MTETKNPIVQRPGSSGLTISAGATPKLIADMGAGSERRFWEFFTAHIRNKNTRKAHQRAVRAFLA